MEPNTICCSYVELSPRTRNPLKLGGEKGEAESTTPAEDYKEEEDECEDGGLFEIFHKIMCIFKIILGLITGNSDPCCPLEIPSFIG
ncbi:hypothetical protein GE061_002969 [Apolygus lucorum]|uniref:Uncharacterized protein n=1 Tax=Apolygus lucorum TaxID=248454 RepID=A0A8S9X2K7_APOLU|nr:hypothetical protein GE061_002969 [Apolygus lucorum]